MKKYLALLTAIILSMAMICLASCGKSELSITGNTEKTMTVVAENSGAGDFVMVGTLEVAEGEQIVLEPALDSGVVELGFVSAEGMDDIDEVPDMEGDAAKAQYTAEVSGTEPQTVEADEGPYLVKVTVNEKATGTIEIKVK